MSALAAGFFSGLEDLMIRGCDTASQGSLMRVNGVASATEANVPPGSILDLNEAGPAMRHARMQVAGKA
ncbi:MAG: hypothetical protein GX644_06000 [Limnobacter sp.]|nr:hypothetical protein [Limnobacter sp.]